MNQQQVEIVTRVLNEHIESNKEYTNRSVDDLSQSIIEAFKAESTACAEAITFIQVIHRYLQKWSQQLKIDGVNSKSMVLNDIKFLLKEK